MTPNQVVDIYNLFYTEHRFDVVVQTLAISVYKKLEALSCHSKPLESRIVNTSFPRILPLFGIFKLGHYRFGHLEPI